MTFYRSSKIDTQEACPGFMVLEEDIVEEDENIVIDGSLDYSFYIMKKGV